MILLTYCRSASVAAATAIQSGADDGDNLPSASSDDAKQNAVEEIDDSSVWTNANSLYIAFLCLQYLQI